MSSSTAGTFIQGRPWPQELENVMRGCRAVAVCVGPGDMGPWQQREVNMALERQARELEFPVIPVLLPGAQPVLGFLGQNTWIDLRAEPDDSNLIAILSRAIHGEAPGSDAIERIQQTVATICPYRGLLYFREEDAPFFFGRDAAIKQLVEVVTHNQFVAVVGASGCGKSSVARAGLIPVLRRDPKTVWEIVTLVPGDRPLHTLAAVLLPLLEPEMTETDRMAETNKLARALDTGNVHLRDVVERVLEKQQGTNRVLVVADQWEELYTLTPEEDTRRRFIDELLEASSHVPLSLVLTLRGDFVGHALAYRPLSDRLQGAQVNLGPMNRGELAAAIKHPAKEVGLSFEPGLVERILDDTGDEPGNLPLLEFVLKQLWDNRSRGQLLHGAYEAMGRLAGAVANKANEIFDKFSPLEQQAVQRIFLQLATPAEEGDYTRRRASFAEISPASMQMLKRLTDERLLVTSPGSSSGEETVEVSHEALIRNWDKLKAWLNEDREFLLWRRRFGEFLGAWRQDSQKEKGGTLLSGAFLVEAEKWLIERGDRLSNEEREYITASTNHRNTEEKKARRRTQISLILITAFALAAGIFGFVSRREANTSLALQMAAQSGQKASKQLADALLLGVAAAEQQLTYETKDNLLRLLRSLPSGLHGYMWGHSDWVWSVAFSPDGKILATGSYDSTVILWDVASRKRIGEPLKHASGVRSIAFSPDGKILATGHEHDNTVILWDVSSRKPLGEPLKTQFDSVWSVAFSPDGKILATRGMSDTVILWDVSSRKPLGEPLKAHSVAFSPDGKTLATGSDDNKV